VEDAYRHAGLSYRPRYTPVVRALRDGPASIRAISREAGITHSAVSQTVAQMAKEGLVDVRPGDDGRERIVTLSPKARAMAPRLDRIWNATDVAARSLEDEIGAPLSQLLLAALAAIDRQGFGERIAAADNI
jgi:DNA-binding MarR family transcriptional regulator